METIDTDDLDPQEQPRNRASVSQPLGAQDFSMNYFELDPGEELTTSLHTHLDQEEAFLVLEGEATFETKPDLDAESETVRVSEGQIVRFDPGEYQQGRNESEERTRVLALGTPQESTDVRIAAPCQNCGDTQYLGLAMIDGEPALECPECGTQVEV